MLAIGETVTVQPMYLVGRSEFLTTSDNTIYKRAFRGTVVQLCEKHFLVQGRNWRQCFLWTDVRTGQVRVKLPGGMTLVGRPNPPKLAKEKKRTRPQGAETRERDKGRKHTRRATVPLDSTIPGGHVG